MSRKQDIGADLVVPTQFMAARLNGLGWLNPISDTRWSNKKNLRPDLLNAKADEGRKFSAPYMSGMVGIAYNRAATGRVVIEIVHHHYVHMVGANQPREQYERTAAPALTRAAG